MNPLSPRVLIPVIAVVAVVSVLIIGTDRASDPTAQDVTDVLAWLTCEECEDGQLARVTDSLGDAAVPLLESFLLGPPDAYVASVEEGLRVELGESAPEATVDRFLGNHLATVHIRAALALRELDRADIVLRAWEDRETLDDTLRYRSDVVEFMEEVILGAGFVGPPVPVPATVEIRPDSVLLFLGAPLPVEVIVRTAEGRVLTGPEITWSVDDPTVVEAELVTSRRLDLAPVEVGTTTVRIQANSAVGEARVEVVADPPPRGELAILSGNRQTGIPGGRLPQPLRIEVRDPEGRPVDGAEILFRVTRGTAELQTPGVPAAGPSAFASEVVATTVAGSAAVQVRLGDTSGFVWVEAEVLGVPSEPVEPTVVRFTLRVLDRS